MEYLKLKDQQEKETNDFLNKYCFFAFSEKQFKEGCEKLNINADKDLNKLIEIISGGYLLKEHKEEYIDLMKKHGEERKEAIKEDTSGLKYCYTMFKYELANHEYGYTYELEETLEALGLTKEEIEKQTNLKAGLEKALAEY